MALVGGGSPPKPGEISLAHLGVLFLDELPEFSRHVLETLREPLESGVINISRAAYQERFPAKFQFIAAMNPCPCGYLTDPNHECTCSVLLVQRYRARVSGPLLDRIDIHIEVPPVSYEKLTSNTKEETSTTIRDRVKNAHKIQIERFKSYKKIFCNAHMLSREIRKCCVIDQECQELMKMAITRLGLSARAYDRILKVSRTIADLETSEQINPQHISEAIQYRSLDRDFTSSI